MNWLKNYIEYKAISVLSFEKSVGTRSTIDKAIKNSSNLRSDLLAKIIETYSDINPSWLITGKGKMLLDPNSINNGNLLEQFLSSSEDISEITRLLLEKNDLLMQSSSFRQYMKSNIDLLEIEEEEKNLEAKKKKVKEDIIKKFGAQKNS